MPLTATIFTFITNLISTGGYPALFLLTLLDSTVLPVPNEAIMPFAGYLISTGRFSFVVVLIVSIVGGVLGALTSYAIGYVGAEPFVRRFGKYVRMKQEDLNKTHAFFEKYGEKIILISRFIPVVRQFISIPAGAAEMNVWKFILYTAIGSALWNSAILYGGYQLGEHWETVNKYSGLFGKVMLIILLVCVWYFVFKKRTKTSANPS